MKNKTLQKVVLLDIHAILHRAYHALPGFTTSKGEPTGALFGLTSMILKIITDLNPDYIIACYDLPQPTFRKKVYEEYKAGRPKTDQELVDQIVRSRDLLNALSVPFYEKAGFEADDLLGTIANILKSDRKLQTIIASGDLDTLQLVDDDKVVVYTLRKGIKDTIVYNGQMVLDRFGFGPEFMADYKGLRGDPSDNIIGIKGIGEKTAQILIQKFETIENIYKELAKNSKAFEDSGIKPRIIELLKNGKEEAMFSKMLAKIKIDVPIDFSLPKQKWTESVNLDVAIKYFSDLEFRNLKDRLKNILSPKDDQDKENKNVDASLTTVPKTENENEIKKLAIALWLLDSKNTDPTLQDIYDFTKTSSLAEAQKKLLGEIKKNGLEKVYYDIELPLIPIIKRAEDRGILINAQYLKELSVRYHHDLDVLEKKIFSLTENEFNINSPKQLADILFDKLKLSPKGVKKTPGGAVSTKESELEKLKDLHPVIAEILSYRELQKILSTYVDNILTMLDSGGRLHTKLNQTGTTTGRMSSDSPNLQNIPAREGPGVAVRRAFLANPRHKLVSFDYSQIEMRVLAWLSAEPALIEIFKNGQDVHSAVAAKVFGVSEKDVTKDMRRKAKVINFGILYGMGVNALKKNLGGSLQEAKIFHESYFKKFPKVKEYFDKVIENVRTKGYTETFFGRRRYLPEIKSPLPYIRAMAERMAMNAPLQGTATGDMVKLAAIKVDELLTKNNLISKTHLLVQVHDELLYEIADDKDLEETIKLIKRTMESVAPECPVPVTVNFSVGPNWADLS